MVPAVIIGVIYVPYVAKPVRGQVLSLREREFVDAARTLGARPRCGSWPREIAPNVVSTLIVFVPLIVANAILTEAGLSYLGAGVQDPNPSWGTMISDGIRLIPSAIHLTLVPGADARRRRARASTSSATASATPSTRARRCASSTEAMARFVAARGCCRWSPCCSRSRC